MRFLRFIFSFLYIRNGYTGQWELSRPRVIGFSLLVGTVLTLLVVALVLQAPVSYERTQ